MYEEMWDWGQGRRIKISELFLKRQTICRQMDDALESEDIINQKAIETDEQRIPENLTLGNLDESRTIRRIPINETTKYIKTNKKLVKEQYEYQQTEDEKTERLYAKFRRIVNHLTKRTFQTLMQQLDDLSIDTEERLVGCVEIILEKALSSPHLATMYAYLAKCMQSLNVQTSKDPEVTVSFRKLFLNRCQVEFEKSHYDDDDGFFERTELTETEKLKQKRRFSGNIILIGELFKLKMITEKIIHACIKKLLSTDDEDQLECVCILMSSVGLDIDHEKSKPLMDKYLDEIKEYSLQQKISTRVQIMLKDLVLLRSNGWIKAKPIEPSEETSWRDGRKSCKADGDYGRQQSPENRSRF